ELPDPAGDLASRTALRALEAADLRVRAIRPAEAEARAQVHAPRHGIVALAEDRVDHRVERRVALEVRGVHANAVRDLETLRAAVRVTQPRRQIEVVAQATVHLQPAREARRNSVLEIGERVVDVRPVAVGGVVLRVAVILEIETELV